MKANIKSAIVTIPILRFIIDTKKSKKLKLISSILIEIINDFRKTYAISISS